MFLGVPLSLFIMYAVLKNTFCFVVFVFLFSFLCNLTTFGKMFSNVLFVCLLSARIKCVLTVRLRVDEAVQAFVY